MKNQLGLSVGDTVMLETPDWTLPVTLSGFTGNDPLLSQSGAYALFFNRPAGADCGRAGQYDAGFF